MDLNGALVAYIILTIIIYLIVRYLLQVTAWSSFILAILIGIIFLSVICPISSVERVMNESGIISLYILIYIITFLLILFYVISKTITDTDPRLYSENRTQSSLRR